MHVRIIAVVGAVSWIVSEVVERGLGGISSFSLALTAVAFGALAVGSWGLGGQEARTRGWTVSVGLLSLGFALMAAVSLDMWASGLGQHEEGPLFFSAVITFTIGILSTGIAALHRHPRWLGASFIAVGLLALGGNAAEIGWLASTANVGLALLLIRMAMPPQPEAVLA